MQNTFSTPSSTSSQTSKSTSASKEVIITYWIWMKDMGLLEESRLEKISWAEARQAWVLNPRPYESFIPRAPKLVKAHTASTPSSRMSNTVSISYNTVPETEVTWAWEREMWLRDQLRKKKATWERVRWDWLTQKDDNTFGEPSI